MLPPVPMRRCRSHRASPIAIGPPTLPPPAIRVRLRASKVGRGERRLHEVIAANHSQQTPEAFAHSARSRSVQELAEHKFGRCPTGLQVAPGSCWSSNSRGSRRYVPRERFPAAVWSWWNEGTKEQAPVIRAATAPRPPGAGGARSAALRLLIGISAMLEAQPAFGAAAVPPDSIPPAARPGYLVTRVDAAYGTLVTRIGNNTGQPTDPVPGVWGADARHVYANQEPWNADHTLLLIENRAGGSPSRLLLDGKTYEPVEAPCAEAGLFDFRWHPSRAHAHELINVSSNGLALSWFDIMTCT